MTKATRRSVLKGLGLIGAGAALQAGSGRSMISAALGYTPNAATLEHNGLVLPKRALAILHDICAQTIPATDTPGAHELDVHGFIDSQLYHCFDEAAQQTVLALLEHIDAVAVQHYGRAFVQCGSKEQLALLTLVERGGDGFDDGQRGVFKYLKNLVVFGYLTTEVGGTKVLAYDPYPGGFEGSVPYASVGRAWLGNVS